MTLLNFRPIGRLSHREKETRWRDAGIRRDSCGLMGRPGMADGVKTFSWAGFGSVSGAKTRLDRLRTIQRNGLLSGRWMKESLTSTKSAIGRGQQPSSETSLRTGKKKC